MAKKVIPIFLLTDGSHAFSGTLSGGSVRFDLKPDKTYTITVRLTEVPICSLTRRSCGRTQSFGRCRLCRKGNERRIQQLHC